MFYVEGLTLLKETFDSHMKAFEDAGLLAHPKNWSYDNAYPEFSAWGDGVEVKNKKPGYVCLRDVGWGYFRVFTRQYAPDGPPVEEQIIRINTNGMAVKNIVVSLSSDYAIVDIKGEPVTVDVI